MGCGQILKYVPYHIRDVSWAYLAQTLNIGAGLLLLPAVLLYLPTEDVGLWFVFITLASIAQLLEFGFQPTIVRNTAYVFAGARSLESQGVPGRVCTDAAVDPVLLNEIVHAARLIYQIVAAMGSLVLLLGGSLYLLSVITPDQDVTTVLGAWVLFSSGYIINFYYGYVNGLLLGRGDIVAANQVIIISRASMLVCSLIALVSGGGLLGLGVGTLFSSVIGRMLAIRFFRRGYKDRNKINKHETLRTVRLMWHNASRLGLVQVGSFLIQRANILIASSFLGLGAAASYGFTVTLMMTLSGVSAVILQVRMPRLAAAQTARNFPLLRTLFGEVIFIAWFVFITGLFFLIFGGQWLVEFIGSNTTLLPTPLLTLFGLVFFLELNHSLAAGYLTSRNHVPFLFSSLLSGLLICIISVIMIDRFEVLGLIAAQGLVQLAYNNWKWPREAKKDLGVRWSELIVLGMRKTLCKTDMLNTNHFK